MRPITDREKRTLRLAVAGVAIYLILFFVWPPLNNNRAAYVKLVKEAQELKLKVEPYEARVQSAKKLMESFHMDPAKLSKATVVGEASAAIQKAATGSGIQVGPVRESSRVGAKELTLKLEGTGPIAAVMGLINRMGSLGYPLIVDEVQLTPEASRPGQVKLSLSIVILDFEQWSKEAPHA